jgi:16S rRNA processing protein RimM
VSSAPLYLLPRKEEFIVIARILRPQGRHGEVLADLLTDFPEKFKERRQLWIGNEDGEGTEYALEDHWFHKGRVVLKLAGVDSISDAERLKGMLMQIPRSQRTELETSSVYVSDLIGCSLVDVAIGQPRTVGIIEDVRQGSGEAPLLVVRNGKQEYEIPFAEEYVFRFDLAKKLLEMRLPSGLLDVNSPVSEGEKREQRGTSPAQPRDD